MTNGGLDPDRVYPHIYLHEPPAPTMTAPVPVEEINQVSRSATRRFLRWILPTPRVKAPRRRRYAADTEPWDDGLYGGPPPDARLADRDRPYGPHLRRERIFHLAHTRMVEWRVLIWLGFTLPYAAFWAVTSVFLQLGPAPDWRDVVTGVIGVVTGIIGVAWASPAKARYLRERDFLLSHGRSVSTGTDWLAVLIAIVVPVGILWYQMSFHT